ncbi:hypothetical protein CHR28_28160 [Streptomyces sp. XY006]|nr:hypothetical protein CHR28_28160 [Streptomyces sp. XY006]
MGVSRVAWTLRTRAGRRGPEPWTGGPHRPPRGVRGGGGGGGGGGGHSSGREGGPFPFPGPRDCRGPRGGGPTGRTTVGAP